MAKGFYQQFLIGSFFVVIFYSVEWIRQFTVEPNIYYPWWFLPQNPASWVYLRDSRGLGPFRSSAWVPGVVRNVCGWIEGRRHVCGASCCTVPRLWRRAWQLLGRVDAPDQRLRTVPTLGWLPGSRGLYFEGLLTITKNVPTKDGHVYYVTQCHLK